MFEFDAGNQEAAAKQGRWPEEGASQAQPLHPAKLPRPHRDTHQSKHISNFSV